MVELYKPLYTVQEAADLLLTTRHVVNAEIREGKLRAILHAGRKKIRGNDLETYIEEYPIIKPETDSK